jgi:hypothetical protein
MQSALLLLSLAALAPGDDSVSLKELGMTLPRTVGGIQYKSTKAFESKSLGYAVGYGNKNCVITLIVYDLDQKQIPAGKDNQPVQAQFQQSIQDIYALEKQGSFKNVQRMKDDLPLPKEVTSTFATAGFTFDVAGGGCKSYILLVGHNGFFFKVRLTQYVVDNQTNDDEVAAFLLALVKQLKPAGKK